MGILSWIVFGGLAGLAAGFLMGGGGGIIFDIIVGIVGALLGGFIMGLLGHAGVTGWNWRSFGVAVLGSVILLISLRLVRGAEESEREAERIWAGARRLPVQLAGSSRNRLRNGESTVDEIPHYFPRRSEKKRERDEPRVISPSRAWEQKSALRGSTPAVASFERDCLRLERPVPGRCFHFG